MDGCLGGVAMLVMRNRKKCGVLFDTARCKACQREWITRNADKIKEYQVQRYKANPGYEKARNLAWKRANPARSSALVMKYQAANKEKVKAQRALHYFKNKERLDARRRRWEDKNRGLIRSYGQNRRARKKKSEGVLSRGLAGKLFVLQRGKCACCRLPLGNNYHMDHIMPLFLGGANSDENIQLLRRKCNQSKWAKHPIEYMQSRGYLL